MADNKKSGPSARPAGTLRPPFAKWSIKFLSELAATSNVRASAQKDGVHVSTAYDARRQKPEFNRAWQAALCEGYDHLEMELLYRLRNGEIKPPKDARRGARTFDNATAFRQLVAHRESAAQHRAIRENEDAGAILASIDSKLDRMRECALKTAKQKPDDKE